MGNVGRSWNSTKTFASLKFEEKWRRILSATAHKLLIVYQQTYGIHLDALTPIPPGNFNGANKLHLDDYIIFTWRYRSCSVEKKMEKGFLLYNVADKEGGIFFFLPTWRKYLFPIFKCNFGLPFISIEHISHLHKRIENAVIKSN